MHDQVRNEELHVWRARIKSGMFDPADLCEFAVRLMDALESAEADLFVSNRCTRADNALKTKMVDWLVDKLSFNTGCWPYYDECPRLCATGKRECLAHDFDAGDFDYGPCWKERARKEVMRHGS